MRAVLFGLVGAVLLGGAAGATELAGAYRGAGADSTRRWNVTATISPAKDGRYKVNITSGNDSCASEMDGVGVMQNRTLRVSGDCDVAIAINGNQLRVTEGPSCINARGGACEFSGSFKKIE